MKALAILAQKDGSGKTTVAVHMAICATRRKLKVAILDIDPQRSAFQWNASRPAVMKLDAIAATASELAGLLQKAKAGGIDLAIVDTAPHSNADAAIVARLADLVLIPCRPARFDLDAIASTVEIAKAANASCAVVINAAPRGKLAEEARSHAVIEGRSVHEYEPDGAAALEIETLYNHVSGLYGNKKRKGSTT